MRDPVDRLARFVTALEQMAEFLSGRIQGMPSIATGKDLAQVRAEVVLLEKVLGQLRKALDSLARLDLAGRQVRLETGRAERVAEAFRVAVQELSPAVQGRVVELFLRELERSGALPPGGGGPVVSGDVVEGP